MCKPSIPVTCNRRRIVKELGTWLVKDGMKLLHLLGFAVRVGTLPNPER